MVEETYENSEKCPVYLLGHSLGSLYSMYFLKLQDKRWKHKYIKGFISVSGPFGGSVESLYAETCGESKKLLEPCLKLKSLLYCFSVSLETTT